MKRKIAVVGAPSSLGIRPYDNGESRQLSQAPSVLRELGLVQRIGAEDLGDVIPPPYQDYVRTPGRARNESAVAGYSRGLGERIEAATAEGCFAVVLGGDCSIVLGSLLGVRKRAQGPVGLVYVDGHADFGTPQESRTGSVASMCLALAVGRGDTPLARLAGNQPLVHDRHVALIGRRDAAEPWYGHAALAESSILDIPGAVLRERCMADVAEEVLQALTSDGTLRGFWIHLDADVIDPTVMFAVDSPLPGGPAIEELLELLIPLVCHPLALGVQLTIYDPGLDPDRLCATRLVSLLEILLLRLRSRDGRAA